MVTSWHVHLSEEVGCEITDLMPSDGYSSSWTCEGIFHGESGA